MPIAKISANEEKLRKYAKVVAMSPLVIIPLMQAHAISKNGKTFSLLKIFLRIFEFTNRPHVAPIRIKDLNSKSKTEILSKDSNFETAKEANSA
jgi:hypothetical protein